MCPLVPISFRVAEDGRRASKQGEGWTDIVESQAKEGKKRFRMALGGEKGGILAVRRRYNDEIQAARRNEKSTGHRAARRDAEQWLTVERIEMAPQRR